MAALLVSLKVVFKEAYVANCTIEEDPATPDDLVILEDLDAEELIENLKNLLEELLSFKREYKTSEKAELFQRNEQFEGLLQKLEADVRSHIRMEHQLKLHIESLTAKQLELVKAKESSDRSIDELRQLMVHKDKEISRLKLEFDTVDSGSRLRNEEIDKSLIKASKQSVKKVDREAEKLRSLLDEKVKEIDSLKKFYASASTGTSNTDLRDRSSERRLQDRPQKTERRILRKSTDPAQNSYSLLENRLFSLANCTNDPRKKLSKGSYQTKATANRPTHYRCKSDV